MGTFSEVKLFQVLPDKLEEFEALVRKMKPWQESVVGCQGIRYLKRFYVFDKIGDPPRMLTKIVKCVKYYSYWEFETLETYTKATDEFFQLYGKEVMKLLLMPFDINCGESV